MRDNQPEVEPVSLSIEEEEKVDRKWKIEIGAEDDVGARNKSGNVEAVEEVPEEFIFPRNAEYVGTSLTKSKT